MLDTVHKKLSPRIPLRHLPKTNNRIWTSDLQRNSVVLYQLSYIRYILSFQNVIKT